MFNTEKMRGDIPINFLIIQLQLLLFIFYSSCYNISYIGTQYIVIPTFPLFVFIMHFFVCRLPIQHLVELISITLVLCMVTAMGNYYAFRKNAELFLAQHTMRQERESFRTVLNEQDNGIIVVNKSEIQV